jgi:hypothetical protein
MFYRGASATGWPPRPVELDHAGQPEIAQFPCHQPSAISHQPSAISHQPSAISQDDYVRSAPVSGIVGVRGGQIVFERYPRMRPDDRHPLMPGVRVHQHQYFRVVVARGAGHRTLAGTFRNCSTRTAG